MKTTTKPAEPLERVLDAHCPDEALAAVLAQCLGATTTTRAGILEPDYRTRLQAATIALTMKHGTAPKRSAPAEPQAVDDECGDDLVERMAHSPQLFKLMEEQHTDMVGRAMKRRVEMEAEKEAERPAVTQPRK